jgi:opacity protein-like surface antigen
MVLSLLSTLSANEEELAKESEVIHNTEHKTNMYVVVKALTTLGDDVDHEDDTELDGDVGYGFGVDLGYRITHSFSVEFDFSYSRSDVDEKEDGETLETASADYYTYALDLVYLHHFTHKFGMFVKGGWEYEVEDIDELGVREYENDFVYGVGLEYAFDETYGFVFEYEDSNIDGPRGAGVFAGLIINF